MWKESLDAGEWTKLADFGAQATEHTETFVDPLPPSAMRIYRLVTPQQPGPVNPMPAILKSPKPTAADFDGTAAFDVQAVGGGALSYQWLFNSNSLSGALGPAFALSQAQFSDTGFYAVTVSDSTGSKTSRQVYLGVRPRITSQPQNQLVRVGEPVTFSIAAQSSWPLVYRWHHNGRPLANATNAVLLLENVQTTDAGRYKVVVSHQLPGGRFATGSSNAVLTITDPPASAP